MGFWSNLLKPFCLFKKQKEITYCNLPADYKGYIGEKKVSYIVDKIYRNKKSIIIRDFYLISPNGWTTQIDELIIASSGIYVIEVKNYKGWIFGNEDNQYWMQVLPKGYRGESIKNRFYNPIKQNNTHISCVKKILKDYKGLIHSLIVFSDEAEFKDLSVYSAGVFVLNMGMLNDVIKKIETQYKDSLSENEIDKIGEVLINVASGIEINHVEQVKQYVERKQKLCSRCGAPLVERSVKNGPNAGHKFLGCSRYPDCKYTRNLD